MQTILETKDLTKKFGGLTAVDRVSLKLKQGELRCILGPNGCGKSTLFNVITGYYKPTSGHAIFLGREISGKPVHVISQLGIGRKFQVPGIFNQLTVYENICVPFFSSKRSSLLGGSSSTSRSHREILGFLEKINLADKMDELAMNLAHGEKQWLEIGMVLASRPKLMLLDEPTAGMTVSETQKTADLIKTISKSTSISILVIEHDIRFVKEISSRITVMYKGAILKEGNYNEIQADKDIRDIYLGRRQDVDH
jgi:urea ABC transporter ATP-binding protein UrtD